MEGWLPLVLNFFQPMLLRCFQKTSNENPQEVLKESFDPITGKMDEHVVREAMPRMRRSIRKAWNASPKESRNLLPRYDKSELYALTETALIESMKATSERVAEVHELADKITDEE